MRLERNMHEHDQPSTLGHWFIIIFIFIHLNKVQKKFTIFVVIKYKNLQLYHVKKGNM